MKGSKGKKKRSKEAFMLRLKQEKRNLKENYLLQKIKKWEKRGWDISQLLKENE